MDWAVRVKEGLMGNMSGVRWPVRVYATHQQHRPEGVVQKGDSRE